MKRFIEIICLCLAFLFLAPSAVANERIVIGHAVDLSGPNAAIGRDYVAGLKTYFDALNAKGGIAGKRIHYIARDDQGVPALAARLAAELIVADKVDFLVGGVGNEPTHAILNSAAFKNSNLVLFAPLTTASYADNPRVLPWRPGYRHEIRYLFSHFGKLGMKEVGIVMQDSASNEQALQSLTDEMKARGMRLVGTARIGAHGEKSPSEAARLAALKPGVVVLIADSIGSGLFLKEFRTHSSQTFVAGTSLTNFETLREVAGMKAVEWTVFSQVVPNPNSFSSIIQAEHNSMMKKYRDEGVSALTLEGFAVAKALAKTIEGAKNYRMAIQEFRMRDNAQIDLGGLTIINMAKENHLSPYLDIALFRKGAGLVF